MISDDEIIETIRSASHPFLGTGELSDTLDYSRQGLLPRLKRLVEKGQLESRKIGNRWIWWHPDRVNVPD